MPSATTEAALVEANKYIESMTKAMNGLLRQQPELSVGEARDLLLKDGFSEVPTIQFASIHDLASSNQGTSE
jgi:hypothetical protein